MSEYEVGLIVVAFALLGTVVLPRLLEDRPLSFPMFYVVAGIAIFGLVPGAPTIDPVGNAGLTERLTELVVIVALMGAGLKLDRPFDPRTWTAAWRLLGITMPLTIAAVALLGWGVVGLHPATAILLGAVIAPTDPVLAADVDAGAPLTELEEERADDARWGTVKFSLTSEAGLNDGLAFPFTYLAIAVAGASVTWSGTDPGTALSELGPVLGEWLLMDVGYRIVAGTVVGLVVGRIMAQFVFRTPSTADNTEVTVGAEALATTFLAYASAELVAGYGFVAVFVAALSLRHFEWEHDYYHDLHDFAVMVERLLMATVLVLFGGALADGLLAPLSLPEIAVGLALLLVIRPLAGVAGFVGSGAPWRDRAIVSFFGIRGIGSFYYLSFALAHASFAELELLIAAERLWSFVGFIVLASIVLHGATASPVMAALDERRDVEEALPSGD